ncbi:MAG: trypsin-like peptidase domain-containing protein [Bdellovibrionales bacterium]|nr:trypsin-like peptidase domain-containing protein [Bdellovibrionales bacterium]
MGTALYSYILLNTKINRRFILATFLLFPIISFAGVYGNDNRQLVHTEDLSQFNQQGIYPAALVESKKIKTQGNTVTVDATLLGDQWGMCEENRFYSQPTSAHCSGFFVNDDKVLTAFHCIKKLEDFNDLTFILNFTSNNEISTSDIENIFKPVALVNFDENLDFAILKVDKKIKDFQPPTFANLPDLPSHSVELAMLGHPLGMPLTYTDGGFIKSYDQVKREYQTNLDAFHINSGSVVFLKDSHQIVGFLKAGQFDMGIRFRPGIPVCNEIRKNNIDQGAELVQKFPFNSIIF